MRKVTVWRMRERYAQTVLTFRITYLYGSISYIFFTQFETKCTFFSIILAEIIITFYLYVMTSTQLTAFVHLCSRNNNMTLRMAAVAVETCWWMYSVWNTSSNIVMPLFVCLYIMFHVKFWMSSLQAQSALMCSFAQRKREGKAPPFLIICVKWRWKIACTLFVFVAFITLTNFWLHWRLSFRNLVSDFKRSLMGKLRLLVSWTGVNVWMTGRMREIV